MKISLKKGSRQKLIGSLTDFSGGMNTVSQDAKLKTNEFRIIKNADITNRGEIKRRGGFIEVASVNWNNFFGDDTNQQNIFNDVIENDGIEKIITNGDNIELQINDWQLKKDKNQKVINNYGINIKTQEITQKDEIKSIDNEVIYNFLGTERKKNTENDDFKNLFPDICNNGQVELYKIKYKGLNLYLSAFGYTYDDQLDFLKGANDENKIVKNINTLYLDDFQDVWFKKISDNDFLVLTNIKYSTIDSLTYGMKTTGIGKDETAFLPIVGETEQTKWRVLPEIPNILFEIKVTVNYKTYNIEEEKEVVVMLPIDKNVEKINDNEYLIPLRDDIIKGTLSPYYSNPNEDLTYLSLTDLQIKLNKYYIQNLLSNRSRYSDSWRDVILENNEQDTDQNTSYQYQLLIYKKVWPTTNPVPPEDGDLVYSSNFNDTSTLTINDLNLLIQSPIGTNFKLDFYIKVRKK